MYVAVRVYVHTACWDSVHLSVVSALIRNIIQFKTNNIRLRMNCVYPLHVFDYAIRFYTLQVHDITFGYTFMNTCVVNNSTDT